MPGQYSSHGVSVTFDGDLIGWVNDFDWEAVAETVERTNVTSQVIGTGGSARVVKEYDSVSIEPVRLDLQFWGPPSFAATDAGKKGTLTFSAPGVELEGEAILVSYGHAGKKREWSRGRASFQLTGAPTGS